MLEVAEHRYSKADFDRPAVRAWLEQRITHPEIVFFRGKHSAGCAHLGRRYMAPDRLQAYLTVLASIPVKSLSMEPLRICEALVGWAKEKGATKFWFSDITGNDLSAFVRHIGARYAGKNYVVDLDDNAGRYG